MSFATDNQTLSDLNLLNRYRPDSVFTVFNQTKTGGGEKLLEEMFRAPLTDDKEINHRCSLFNYFQKLALHFPFTREQMETVESYINARGKSSFFASLVNAHGKKLKDSFLGDKSFAALQSGVQTTTEVLKALSDLVSKINHLDTKAPYAKQVTELRTILNNESLKTACEKFKLKKDSMTALAKCDHLLRYVFHSEMKSLMDAIYELDVYIAVSNVAAARNFSYALALPKKQRIFHVSDLRHPGLKKAIGNHISLSEEQNLIFLTGANMAGKSTIMKSFGIAVYLAHMGFPIAAEEMVFSVKDGLYSSINVPDNLQMGYSHFYAEVLRVKEAAESVSSGKDLVIIFDELFKGTNVKDAYDATLAVTKAFGEYRNCFFIISTHIVEAGEALQKDCDNIRFLYMPTVMEGNIPRYTYKITEGISADRHGMTIIENEGILEMIKAAPVAVSELYNSINGR